MKKGLSGFLTIFLLLFLVSVSGGCGGASDFSEIDNDNPVTQLPTNLNIKIWIDDLDYSATLNDTDSAREFAALLPLDLEMTDWLNREKVAALPKAIFIDDAPVKPFEAGDIAYYVPNQSLVIFYTSEGSSLVPGLYSLGIFEWGSEFLENSGAPVRVRIELVEAE